MTAITFADLEPAPHRDRQPSETALWYEGQKATDPSFVDRDGLLLERSATIVAGDDENVPASADSTASSVRLSGMECDLSERAQPPPPTPQEAAGRARRR